MSPSEWVATLPDKLIDIKTLNALPEYSCSIPTGTTIGKAWKCNVNAYNGGDPLWIICEYADDPTDPNMVLIKRERAVIQFTDRELLVGSLTAHFKDQGHHVEWHANDKNTTTLMLDPKNYHTTILVTIRDNQVKIAHANTGKWTEAIDVAHPDSIERIDKVIASILKRRKAVCSQKSSRAGKPEPIEPG